MSILRSLLRLVDPIEHRQRSEDERRQREALPPEVDRARLARSPAPHRTEPAPLRVCRICEGESAEPYCPVCLADTLEPRS